MRRALILASALLAVGCTSTVEPARLTDPLTGQEVRKRYVVGGGTGMAAPHGIATCFNTDGERIPDAACERAGYEM